MDGKLKLGGMLQLILMLYVTLIGVVALYRLLHPLAMITKCLQGKAVDIVKAIRDIQEVKHDFPCLRDGVDMEFQAIYNQAERLGQSVGVDRPCQELPKCRCTGKWVM